MNEKLSYNGVVTLVQKVNNRVVSKKYHNAGDDHLFDAYARAISGQSIANFVPKTVDIGITDGGSFSTIVKDGVTIPVLVSYKGANTDGGEYGVPYCRVSIALFSNMFKDTPHDGALTVQLKSKLGGVLADVNAGGLMQAIKDTSSGIQLIMLWDLYVTNEIQNTTGGNS